MTAAQVAEELARALILITLATPLLALLVLTVSNASPQRIPEHRLQQVTAATYSLGLLCSLILLCGLALGLVQSKTFSFGVIFAWRSYHFALDLVLDPLSASFLFLNFLLSGIVGAFSARYLHNEPGFSRFYILLLLASTGVAIIATAARLDLLFAGWELLGLSSALLVAFFLDRHATVENALKVYSVYRVADAAFLFAIVLEHQSLHASSSPLLNHHQNSLIALSLVLAATGKGAIVPFTPWLQRAMDGPTPSSAIFYGALSIHASPFLLLRSWPLLEHQPAVRLLILFLGLLTALYANLCARVATDIKSILSLDSAAQVGLIWIEIAAGLTNLALAHLLLHALWRSWQLLSAPSALEALRAPRRSSPHWSSLLPKDLAGRLQVAAVERFGLDSWLFESSLARPLRLLRWLDSLDRRLAQLGEHSDPNSSVPPAQPLEES